MARYVTWDDNPSKYQATMDEIANILSDVTIAERIMGRLNEYVPLLMGSFITLHNNVHLFLISRNSTPIIFRMGVSHVSLSMIPNGDLLVLRNRGRPTMQEVVVLSCPRKMRKESKGMKKEMSFKDKTEMLLVISIASDDMIRSVHMFPDAFYMDITANTNK